ncbi:hypothetical protein ABFS82_14G220100 [Erythranthe guttata]|uniref:Peptidase metallopeptidase domain-containing protein n=1 Tax=Erythranthe guttata TaxID=4155 RepID=A0A022R6Q1_ERYGU|nr:PREDICTED: metalloendoproteinase 1-like [Erythranthe guttata]EYU35921.1 hypothetical protein MIMGU_mgv1a019701mg [Erythranthe guttata]|eukprot:XP_012838132.1 PREDICTED: metalloendoproteinase 1-like [Erythranthe guttata]
MAPQNLFITCIFLFSLLNPFHLSHAHSHNSNAKNHPSPLSAINNLVGVRKGQKAKGLVELKTHLSNLGYMKNNNNEAKANNDLFDDDLELAIKKYQVFFHLNVNGILDAKTVEHLLLPRCGVADFVNLNASQFKNEIPTIASHYTFFPGEPKWPPGKTNLTYSFPPGASNEVMQAIKDATQLWAGVTHFKFTYITDYDHADIKISFQVWDHKDGAAFDGRGGILAHAFAPSDGRLHFDGDEVWVDGVVPGKFDLQMVGLHELGHVLGLGHTTDGGAIMTPTLGSGFRKGLGQDDINGIKALYHL